MIPEGTKRIASTLSEAEHQVLTGIAHELGVRHSTLLRAALATWLIHGDRDRVRSQASIFRSTSSYLAKAGISPLAKPSSGGVDLAAVLEHLD